VEPKPKTIVSGAGLRAGVTFGALVAKKSVRVGSAVKGFALNRTARKPEPSDYQAVLATADAYPTLWKAVRADLRERGVERVAVIAELERLLIASRESRREDDEDAVTGVLDSVEGFAPAHSRL